MTENSESAPVETSEYTGRQPKELAEAIRAGHQWTSRFIKKSEGLAKCSVVLAWRTGAALNAAKAQVEHGGWSTWLSREVPELGGDQAQRYMKLAREIPHVRNLERFGSLSEAYRSVGILNGDKAPTGVRSVATGIGTRGADGVLSRIRSFSKQLAKSQHSLDKGALGLREREQFKVEIDKVMTYLLELKKSIA